MSNVLFEPGSEAEARHERAMEASHYDEAAGTYSEVRE
jgi:hypothetical protein